MIKEKHCLGCSRLAGKAVFHPIAEFSKRYKKLSGENISHWQANCKAVNAKKIAGWRAMARERMKRARGILMAMGKKLTDAEWAELVRRALDGRIKRVK